jgi:hypothetical protein
MSLTLGWSPRITYAHGERLFCGKGPSENEDSRRRTLSSSYRRSCSRGREGSVRTASQQVQARCQRARSLSTLNAAQVHFAEGLFVATPPVTGAMPPGDGAVLIVSKDRKGGLLIWTKGTNACTPFPLPDEIVRTLGEPNSSAGEIVLPDDSGEERKL